MQEGNHEKCYYNKAENTCRPMRISNVLALRRACVKGYGVVRIIQQAGWGKGLTS